MTSKIYISDTKEQEAAAANSSSGKQQFMRYVVIHLVEQRFLREIQ